MYSAVTEVTLFFFPVKLKTVLIHFEYFVNKPFK